MQGSVREMRTRRLSRLYPRLPLPEAIYLDQKIHHRTTSTCSRKASLGGFGTLP